MVAARERQRRPAPLILGAEVVVALNDEESNSFAWDLSRADSTQVPVRKTFIEYGVGCRLLCRQEFAASTAPAGSCEPTAFHSSKPESFWLDVEGPSISEEDNVPLPALLYQLSPTSARAAGLFQKDGTGTCGSGRSSPSRTCPLQQGVAQDEQEKRCNRRNPGSPRSPLHEVEEVEIASSGTTRDGSDDDDTGVCPEYSETAKLPSVGSAAHGAGTCKRCCFFPKGRCNNGEACHFCHFAHEKRRPKNKKKTKKRRKGRRASAESPVTPGPQDMMPDTRSPSRTSTSSTPAPCIIPGTMDEQLFVVHHGLVPSEAFNPEAVCVASCIHHHHEYPQFHA
mmetsp:Transcript_34976/g.69059  ORF Transcript_34976/g.69059 Transcript_34976/m.69059 type:complete len:339 (-) Transcript_34976:97-1113(-)